MLAQGHTKTATEVTANTKIDAINNDLTTIRGRINNLCNRIVEMKLRAFGSEPQSIGKEEAVEPHSAISTTEIRISEIMDILSRAEAYMEDLERIV